MKLDHIAIYVSDLEKMKEFYIKYFDAKYNSKYQSARSTLETYFLTFECGETRLELMTRKDIIDKEKAVYRTGYTHMAFNVGSKEKVDELTKKLEEDGFKVISEPRMTGDGYYESCILDPEGNQVEITE
ncbi:VOC family protein [Fusobacterium sp. PH5-44]|uniref:VOC family protein n=1 Tax=unclassified Fusobacterium TaxID=2648384 RepID=UPI003D24AF75